SCGPCTRSDASRSPLETSITSRSSVTTAPSVSIVAESILLMPSVSAASISVRPRFSRRKSIFWRAYTRSWPNLRRIVLSPSRVRSRIHGGTLGPRLRTSITPTTSGCGGWSRRRYRTPATTARTRSAARPGAGHVARRGTAVGTGAGAGPRDAAGARAGVQEDERASGHDRLDGARGQRLLLRQQQPRLRICARHEVAAVVDEVEALAQVRGDGIEGGAPAGDTLDVRDGL